MKKHFFSIALIGFMLASCNQSSSNLQGGGRTDSLSYEMIVQMQSVNDCEPGNNNCTYIRFEFPEFTNITSPLNDSLRLLLQDFFANKEKNIMQKDSVMLDFIESYVQFTKLYPDAKASWEVDQVVSVQNQNPKWITLSCHQESYTGGAHPNSHTQYYILDKSSGKQLQLVDFFDTLAIKKLTILGEPLFCAAKGIAPEQGLDEAGYWFPDNRFKLNNNFYFSENGLTFFYNAYEVGPYVAGSTEITIPASKIVKLMKQ